MFGVGYFASNADDYFMVLNNPNFSVGIIDDNPEKYKVRDRLGLSRMPRKDVVMLSSLLPPPEAVSAYVDGRVDIGADIYYRFLNSDVTAQNIISVLLKVFFTGRNMVLFIPRDEATSIKFVPVLGTYFLKTFGIFIGDIRNPSSSSSNPDPVQFANVLSCLYLYDNLSFLDFCMNYPEGVIINQVISNKIIYDNKITADDIIKVTNNPSPTDKDIVDYANMYARSIKNNTNRVIEDTNKQYRQVITMRNKEAFNK